MTPLRRHQVSDNKCAITWLCFSDFTWLKCLVRQVSSWEPVFATGLKFENFIKTFKCQCFRVCVYVCVWCDVSSVAVGHSERQTGNSHYIINKEKTCKTYLFLLLYAHIRGFQSKRIQMKIIQHLPEWEELIYEVPIRWLAKRINITSKSVISSFEDREMYPGCCNVQLEYFDLNK